MTELSILFILKIFVTFYVAILVPVYWRKYGPANFLWLSDVGLFLTLIALWLESPLLISMAMVGIFPLEVAWMVDYFYRLATGKALTGVTAYMFKQEHPLYLRGLSLFHIFIPVIWIWLVWRWGYDPRALGYQSALLVVLLLSTYFLTPPGKNINWVFKPKEKNWNISELAWLSVLIFGVPLLIYCPMHWLLMRIFAI